MSLDPIRSAPGKDPFEIEAVFPATPARVFKAWSDAEQLAQWFGRPDRPVRDVQIDFRVGGAWRCAFDGDDGALDVLQGRYLEIEPGRRLVFSWVHQRTDINGESNRTGESKVTVTFEPLDTGARVHLIHEAVITEAGRRGIGGGWADSFNRLLNSLRSPHD